MMKHASSQTVKLLNEERALLMSLAAKRDASYSDVLRLGLYQLAKLDGFQTLLLQAVQARLEHVFEVEAVWQGIRVEETPDSSQTDIMHTGGL
ncbi:MAG: hypothetical protein OEU68_15285 [Nitrospira sp.]|nr:hypothetical protein [Nitrospira sp.]MDH4245610.1 hypothetical protein [Nitrospira sp.]MDH4356938.1 hypothetical protein [Nitrospira sp.]MDH5318907.1 hypothetical protein [Nitrospira sp.]MDH5497129.1 hypothetical protein [Nitrospira sp.]